MKMFRRLWNDDAGVVICAELVLVLTIVVIGMIVGLVSLRNQVVQELVDCGQSIGSLSQSYAYCGVVKARTAWTDGCFYIDLTDFCQARQEAGFEPGGILLHGFVPGPFQFPPGGEIGPGGVHGFGGGGFGGGFGGGGGFGP